MVGRNQVQVVMPVYPLSLSLSPSLFSLSLSLSLTLCLYQESEVAVIQANIEATDQNKAPIFTVGGYAVLDLLGSGAFGSVYKVRKPIELCCHAVIKH